MAKTKVLLVEEIEFLEVALQSRLTSLNFDIVNVLAKPEMVIDFLSNNKVDVILMDTFISEKYNAFDAIKVINRNYSTPVILLNGNDKLSSEHLSNSEAKLLMQKPLNDIELAFNIKNIVNNNKTINNTNEKNHKDYIFVKADYRLNKIRLNDIFYIEASKDYVTIYTTDNAYTVHITMKEIEEALPTNNFIRTHRSFIVNIDKIFSIKYPEILIEQKMKTIQIGGLYRKRLMQLIDVI